MNASQLLAELRAAGAELRINAGRLEAKRLPSHLASLARVRAAELRELLRSSAPGCPPAGSFAPSCAVSELGLSIPVQAALARVVALAEEELGAHLVEVRPVRRRPRAESAGGGEPQEGKGS